jgi:hypothetical protein
MYLLLLSAYFTHKLFHQSNPEFSVFFIILIFQFKISFSNIFSTSSKDPSIEQLSTKIISKF